MTRLRKRVGERLLEAKTSTAMLTTFNEAQHEADYGFCVSSTVTRLKNVTDPSGLYVLLRESGG